MEAGEEENKGIQWKTTKWDLEAVKSRNDKMMTSLV